MTFFKRLWRAIEISRTRSAIEKIRQMGYTDLADEQSKRLNKLIKEQHST